MSTIEKYNFSTDLYFQYILYFYILDLKDSLFRVFKDFLNQVRLGSVLCFTKQDWKNWLQLTRNRLSCPEMLGFPWFFKYRAHKCITEDTCFLLHSNFQLQYGAHKCITEDTRFLLHSNLQLLQVTSSPSLDLDQSCQAGEQAKINS